jgi:phosphopantothenoylcysteine decarboxylase/phosphopantothenate--cysteine ligase
MLAGRSILLVIGGGIAAYKALELIRRLRDAGARVVPVMTASAAEFVTPLSVASLAGAEVHRALFDLTAEAKMGHIELSRSADLVVVAPATADLIARLAGGMAPDLASTLLLATDKRVLLAPAMNVRMWEHPAVRRNVATLKADGALFVGPERGVHGLRRVGVRAARRGARDHGGLSRRRSGRRRSGAAMPSSPPGPRTSPSTPCASSPTARRARRVRRWRRRCATWAPA